MLTWRNGLRVRYRILKNALKILNEDQRGTLRHSFEKLEMVKEFLVESRAKCNIKLEEKPLIDTQSNQ